MSICRMGESGLVIRLAHAKSSVISVRADSVYMCADI